MAAASHTTSGWLRHGLAKPVVFLACVLPFGYLLWGALAGTLGANPAEALIRATGDWTLRFLCITLAVTPLRRVANLPALLRFRRMLGLAAFGYGALHMLCYAGFDMAFDAAAIVRDIAKRPFILVGFAALVMMLPLAATSCARAIRVLGAARWQALHRLVYVVALAGLLHFWWMRSGKNDFSEPVVYAVIVAILLAWRIAMRFRAGRERRGAARAELAVAEPTPVGSEASRGH